MDCSLPGSSVHGIFQAIVLECVAIAFSDLNYRVYFIITSQVVQVVKNLSANARDKRDAGSVPRLGRSPAGEHGNLLQYSCLENPYDRGAW